MLRGFVRDAEEAALQQQRNLWEDGDIRYCRCPFPEFIPDPPIINPTPGVPTDPPFSPGPPFRPPGAMMMGGGKGKGGGRMKGIRPMEGGRPKRIGRPNRVGQRGSKGSKASKGSKGRRDLIEDEDWMDVDEHEERELTVGYHDGTIVLPPWHVSCQHIVWICPGDPIPDLPKWECPLEPDTPAPTSFGATPFPTASIPISTPAPTRAPTIGEIMTRAPISQGSMGGGKGKGKGKGGRMG